MTWINFLSYLGMGYALYYVAVFLMDSRSVPRNSNEAASILTFTEKVEPEKVSLKNFGNILPAGTSGPASVALGGVSIKDLFALALKDAVEFTRSVSF